MKRLTLFFMVISIIFTTACGANPATSTDKEQEQFIYEAKEIYSANGGKGISSVAMGSNGELAVYNYYEKKIYIFDKEGTKAGEIEAGESWDGLLAFDKDNKLYALLQYRGKNDKNENILLKRKLQVCDAQSDAIENQSGIVEIKGDSKYLTGELVERIEADSKGNIYCLKVSEEVEVLDAKLKNVTALQGKKFLDIDIDEEDNIMGLCYDTSPEAYIEKVSGKDNKSIWKKNYNQSDVPESIYYNIKSKNLFILNSQGIASCDDKGNIKANIAKREKIEGLDNIFRFIIDEEENIYTLGKSGSAMKIIKYIKTQVDESDGTATAKKEINVYFYSPYPHHVRQEVMSIINKFHNAYPNIHVNLIETNDINQLNTEILAGKADILFGYYYVKDYISKNLLADLEEAAKNDADFYINDYIDNIIEASRYKEKLYIIPVLYEIQPFVGNKALLGKNNIELDIDWTWIDFYKAINKANEKGEKCYGLLKIMEDEDYWFQNTVRDILDYAIDWDKKEAKFESKEFLDTIKLLKEIKSCNRYIHPEAQSLVRGGRNKELIENETLFYPGWPVTYHNILIFRSYPEGIVVLPEPRSEYSNSIPFLSYNASILEGSSEKEEAWLFIKYLLSEDIQFYLSEKSMVINKEADNKRQEAVYEEFKNYNKDSKDAVEATNKIKSSLNKNSALRAPDELFNTIWEEIKAYLSGGKSAEETAKTIQNKVELYLNE